MKKLFALLLPALLCLSLIPQPVSARITNRVAAIVGSQIITSRDLDQAITVEHAADNFRTLDKAERDEIRSKKLNELIDELLISQKAASVGISITDENVDGTIDRVLQQNHMTKEDLKKALTNQGMSFKSYRNKIASDLLKAKFVSKVVKANIVITNEEIIDYAKAHELFDNKESVTIAQIFIPENSPNAVNGEKNKIWKEINDKLKNEENFYALASEFSEGPAAAKGGRLGTFERGNLLAEIEEVAYKLPLGEASDVIKTSLGYHIIMVSNRTGENEENSLTPDSEAKIKKKLYNLKLEESIKKLSQDLRQEFKVKIMP
jgi:parvulin-like peptidyl-prolyl isomerase